MEQWFEQNPTALDMPLDIAGTGSVRSLVMHIFLVELHFAHLVLGLEAVDFERMQREIAGNTGSDRLFAVSEEATARFKQYLAEASPQDLATVLPVSPRLNFTASKRKMTAQALTHGIRHWAQLSTLLRQRGFKQDWNHDFLMSPAMD